ncbi:MAG: hypothetical protein NC114_06590 [Ruminococcus flavefaciens]|nr:hypothetical protein [Ruminococcus flavefaciens]
MMEYYNVSEIIHFINVTTTMRCELTCATKEEIPERLASILESVGTNDVITLGDSIVAMEHVAGISFYITKVTNPDTPLIPKMVSEPIDRRETNAILKEAFRIAQKRNQMTDEKE